MLAYLTPSTINTKSFLNTATKPKNVNARIRFPIVLDRKAKAPYADLSALDGIVTNLDNAGKYSRFDLSKLPIPEDADKKLVDVMRKYTNLIFDKIPAEAISEQPLNAEDRKVSAVRKLQLTLADRSNHTVSRNAERHGRNRVP